MNLNQNTTASSDFSFPAPIKSTAASSTTSKLNGNSDQMEKVRVLCLHGYRQNAENFKSKMGSFRKILKKYVEFSYTSAPHKAPPLTSGEDSPSPAEKKDIEDDEVLGESWWFNKDDGTFKGTNECGPAVGFEQSLKHIETVWREEGPFQGLLGFSQGACFAGILCLLSSKSMTTIKPEFVILASGFKSGSLIHKNIYEETATIPSLHIFGETDEIIPGEMSEALSRNFDNAEILKHSGGHYLPATAQQKQTYINFFQDRLQEYLENKELENANGENAIVIETK